MFPVPAFLRPLLLAVATGVLASASLHAELTPEQKKELFRKSRAAASPSPSPKHGSSKVKHSSVSGKHSSPSTKKHTASPVKHSVAVAKKTSAAEPPIPPSPASSPVPSTRNAVPQPEPTPSHSVSAPLPLPHGANPSAPITIEKSGTEADQGLASLPEPPPAVSSRGWGWLFGSRRTYSYLNASTRAAIDRAPVRKGRWKYVIVHNSGTREGNARVFDIYHLRVRHMQNGLAYHFVIGDGHGSGDGQIEIGHRWTAQINGGHVASDYLNDISLGICLVGDFNRDIPTKAQIGALDELVSYLRSRVGKTQGRQAIVHAHKEINPRPTDCPGNRFPYGWLHAKFGSAR